MPKYSSPDDVYAALVERSDENWLLGLLAFAIVEERRVEWAIHLRDTTGKFPSELEIIAWYEAQPESALIRARGDAESALRAYAEDVIVEYELSHKEQVEQGVVVQEVKRLGRFWPQFGVNVVGGFVGSLMFAAFLVVIAFLIINDASTNDIASHLKRDSVGLSHEKNR